MRLTPDEIKAYKQFKQECQPAPREKVNPDSKYKISDIIARLQEMNLVFMYIGDEALLETLHAIPRSEEG